MILLYVLGFLLFIVAVWQTYLNSSHYRVIGAIAALFLLGLFLVLLGMSGIGRLLIFIFESWYVLLVLLILSSRVKNSFKYLKLLIFLYAVFMALLMWFFDIKYFWFYLVLSTVYLFFNLKIQLDKKDEGKMFSHIQFETLHGVDKKHVHKKDAKTSPFKRLLNNHLYTNTFVYVLSMVVAYYIFNGGF